MNPTTNQLPPSAVAALAARGISTTRLLTLPEICHFLSVSRRTVWRWVADGTLAKPISVSRRIKRWNPADLLPLLHTEQPTQTE